MQGLNLFLRNSCVLWQELELKETLLMKYSVVTGIDPACPPTPPTRTSTKGPHIYPKPGVSAV